MNETDGDVCLYPVAFPGFGLILINGELTNSEKPSRIFHAVCAYWLRSRDGYKVSLSELFGVVFQRYLA
jgi:hypothetical protein